MAPAAKRGKAAQKGPAAKRAPRKKQISESEDSDGSSADSAADNDKDDSDFSVSGQGQLAQKRPPAKRAKRAPRKKQTMSESEDGSTVGDNDNDVSVTGRGQLAHLHAALDAPQRVKQLERENAALRAEIEDLRSQLGTYEAPITKMTYTSAGHTQFMKDIHTPADIALLDLSALVRETNSYKGDWYPQWKPDKRLDALTIALISGTSNVKGLDLGDAKWASEDKYVKELRTLLVKYKPTLTYLRVTMRALVDRYIVQKTGKAKYRSPETYVNIDILATVANFTKLERLAIVFSEGPGGKQVYRGEFSPMGAKKSHWAKLKQIEIYLTKCWAEDTLGVVDKSYESDAETEGAGAVVDRWKAESIARRRREAKDDPRLTDLLKYRAPIITLVDMKEVGKYSSDTPSALPELLSKLTALRSIALRAEWLPVTEKMKQLESLEVVVGVRLSRATVESLVTHVAESGPLQRIKRLHLASEGFKVKEKHSALLRALGERCKRLEEVRIKGCGWKEDDLTVLLEGGAPLRELHLDQCGAVEAVHLPMIVAIQSLAVLRLPSRLLGKPGTEALNKRSSGGLDLRWQH